ncbi:HAD-IIA family hydrolase [Wenxinia marina]|uniref:Putative sugar phosphatases of the HAD superfamily n=1 Tax=Wenxinia marina DSM 24838 TaxID=1123501 RepID=A0A0D0QGW8_9RHOB|nr:HAD hydrolase-like protein [Wenxinia marina]KIQ70248.1 putative sugar phosphatases of the HAD superfamily [Wenxinia marina DSM 24838]GGL50033.1 haloacid dehalogenase [Wenxinia marina]
MTPDPDWAFAAYEAVRGRLPSADFGGVTPRAAADLSEAAEGAELVLLDAYGVLNVGEAPVPGAAERVAALRAEGRQVRVVSNSAGYPKRVMMARWRSLGFDFAAHEVVSSRDAALAHLATLPRQRWGVMLSPVHGAEELEDLDHTLLGEDPEGWEAGAFLLLGADGWTEARQERLEAALRDRPRPVLVGNPDIVAPREGGLSLEPGHWAHRLAHRTGVAPDFFGKPFAPVFERALAGTGVTPDRVLMVGDTLQTDILGGRAMGFRSALVTRWGALAGADVDGAITRSGIVPDWTLETI